MVTQITKADKLLFWIKHLPDQIMRMPEEALSHKPNPKKWSKKEILGHLADSGMNNWQRFALAKKSVKELIVTPYPQDHLVRVNAYQDQNIEEIVALWRSLNLKIYHLINNYSEKELSLPVDSNDADVNNLSDLAKDYVDHLEHHLAQIFSSFEKEIDLPAWQLSLLSSEKLLHTAPDPFIALMSHGSMIVELYQPVGKDLQEPHKQDELYVVISGTGIFRREEVLIPFVPGDVLFVPAGEVHRFESFTEDFKTWVIFYGPQGGEKNETAN